MSQTQPTTIIKSMFGKALLPLVIVCLIVSQFWLYRRVVNLQKDLEVTTKELVSTKAFVVNLRNDVDYVIPIAENANFYAHSHYSDVRLKTDIVPLTNSLEDILQLQGVQYHWRAGILPEPFDNNQMQFGFVAQDVQQIFPELVHNGPNGYLIIDYEKLIPILVEALKEQQAVIEDLQGRIRYLEIRIR